MLVDETKEWRKGEKKSVFEDCALGMEEPHIKSRLEWILYWRILKQSNTLVAWSKIPFKDGNKKFLDVGLESKVEWMKILNGHSLCSLWRRSESQLDHDLFPLHVILEKGVLFVQNTFFSWFTCTNPLIIFNHNITFCSQLWTYGIVHAKKNFPICIVKNRMKRDMWRKETGKYLTRSIWTAQEQCMQRSPKINWHFSRVILMYIDTMTFYSDSGGNSCSKENKKHIITLQVHDV